MQGAGAELKLWRKLVKEKHPLSKDYADSIVTTTLLEGDRINAIKQAVALAEREVNRLKNENKMLSTFSGISAER
ncbi:hypothetical protein COOONC_12313 [Cooperia oncophora]